MSARRPSLARLALVVALALAAAFQVVRSAAVTRFVGDRPDLAARLWPGHPRVALALAMADIGRSAARAKPPGAATIAAAMRAARGAPLAVEPFLISGAVAIAGGQAAKAEALFVEARRRDPRSPAARYFLAQHYLATGRAGPGLAEASALTRLVSGGDSALVPGLVQYAHSPGAVPILRRTFAADPALGDGVLGALARDADNAPLVVALAGDSIGRAGASGPPSWQGQLVAALVERGDYGQAFALWRKIGGTAAVAPGLFNPQFVALPAPPPFNWAIASGDFGVAEAVAPDGLQVIYYGRANADFARQLMLLGPGDYELRMQVTRSADGDEASGLAWSLACRNDGRALMALPIAGSGGVARPLVARFTVPANCPAQLLKLSGTARDFAASEQVMIAQMQLTKVARQ